MKAIALYLPQYHNVKENNMWWGEGYTDWKAMEKAKPLYDGHKQPKTPLHNYKYDLEKKETMQWQANLMKKYGIYGMAIYHYWFKDAKQILEKPVENLLKWKDVDMPFCFYWANESWVRSWSAVENQNVWAAGFEQKELPDENRNGILLEQTYGDKAEWIKHFEYFEPFFFDDRYIKIDGKPLVMLYKPAKIECLKDMIQCWQECAEKKGWNGIYVIGANCTEECEAILDMQLIQEPRATIERNYMERFGNKNRMEVARYLSYDDVWKNILQYSTDNAKTLFGGFSNYDDTARHGNAGTVIFNGTAEKFKIYLTELYAKNAAVGNEYVFINAWNEWGEGMYLEPDEQEQYGYLEAISYAEAHYKDEVYKYGADDSMKNESEIHVLKRQKQRSDIERDALNIWLGLREKNIGIDTILINWGFKNVAIYGYGMLGKHLVSELKNSEVNLKYVIDINADGINIEIPVIKPSEECNECDAIIVSNIHIYKDIVDSLSKSYKGEIISLEKVLEEANI